MYASLTLATMEGDINGDGETVVERDAKKG